MTRNRTTNSGEMRLCGELDSEEALQAWLESYFEDNDWMAIREVSPHRSQCRADLLVQHDDYGWIGIETKYFDGDGGAKAAAAHHQITRKYRGKEYIGNKVDLWAVCPYFRGLNNAGSYSRTQQTVRGRFMREFFCRHGIGYIDLDRSQLLIDYNYSSSAMKIPVDSGGKYEQAIDIERIRESVQRKCDKYDYISNQR